MGSQLLRRAAAAALFTTLLLAPGGASAGSETLKRSVSNILAAPVDLGLSPLTAGIVIYRNITTIDDSRGVRIAYALPGYVWTAGLFAGASVLRELSGLFELLPGLALLFTDAEMDPLFDPAEQAEAILLDQDVVVLNLRIGVDYTAVTF